jgi:predicted transcriptional regulator
MDQVFAALKADARRQILVYLSGGDLTLKQIRSHFPFSTPAMLYHLRMLEEARFIEHRGQHYTLMSGNVAKAFNAFLRDLCPATPNDRDYGKADEPQVASRVRTS